MPTATQTDAEIAPWAVTSYPSKAEASAMCLRSAGRIGKDVCGQKLLDSSTSFCPYYRHRFRMRCVLSKSPVLLIVIALLGIIVIVLILPDVDLPDTAFQRNSSLQALRAVSHPVQHASANGTIFRLLFQFEGASIPPRQARQTCARRSKDLPVLHEALRC